MRKEEVIRKIEEQKIIAIIRGLDTETVAKTAVALEKGGIGLIEVTFDQKAADGYKETATGISEIKKRCKNVIVGAGTVLTTEQADIAVNAGAEFIISPDSDEKVIRHTVKKGVVSIPGAYTATEIKRAHDLGADLVKVFPCIDGALSYIKAIKAPLSHIKLLAFGGINADNAKDFLKAGAVGVGVGSALVNKEFVKNDEYDKLTALAEGFIHNLNN